ncbi:MAG: dTDP-glucose 4,6-dehydratase [Fimbriimonadaceae bacterium]|nr:dTDP-glucose 4,6-dehydratase [Fimbriimonadaceae bacterium]
MNQTVLVTGGCGFIGSNFLNWATGAFPDCRFVNLDNLGYAANPLNVHKAASRANYVFVHQDLRDFDGLLRVVDEHQPTLVVHLAAETHVDRSIKGPRDFVETNVVGTFNLLETCRVVWGGEKAGRVFHHVSTDEVYGSLGDDGAFKETTPYDPSSPYSATKAASDHLVHAYGHTYGLDIRVTNCSNNYGPFQYPEKLIPLVTLNCVEGKPIPVYGTGRNVRDWLYVGDHCRAIWEVAHRGRSGETYNVGGNSERSNIEVVRTICQIVGEETGQAGLDQLITYVQDRPGHDWRYAIDATKLRDELGWEPATTFEEGIRETVKWYVHNPDWVASVRSGSYREWIEANYGHRSEAHA